MTQRREAIFQGRSFGRAIAMVAVAIVVLFSVDTFLAKTEIAEGRVEAARFYAKGRQLMEAGRNLEAVEQFRSAISLQRDNQSYPLGLAEALLAAGRLSDAEATLNDLLQQNPLRAEPNLAMARVLLEENRIDDGVSYYHRAIYGQWQGDKSSKQLAVRFELADVLNRQGSKESLLAELLPLQNDAPDDVMTRKKLARLFIAAGAPARASEIFRDILRRYPQDADTYRGLGEAEFARTNYRAAQTHFLTALRLNATDHDTQERLDLCNRILELDPTRRGLVPDEQYRRSRRLVEQVLEDAKRCLGEDDAGPSQELIKTVQTALRKPVPKSRQSSAIESNLDWAEQLWQARKTDCKTSIIAAEEPLALVMALLAQ